jgi:hypothetical protein
MSVEKQEWFARVIVQGVSNSEACRIVGINRRTGHQQLGLAIGAVLWTLLLSPSAPHLSPRRTILYRII